MTVSDSVGVYLDTDTCQWHFKRLQCNNLIYTESIPDFLSANHTIKYAAFHVPFNKSDTSWLDRIEALYAKTSKIFIFCSELHAHTVESLIGLDRPKIVIFICGHINHQFTHAPVHRWLDWFVTSVYFYKMSEPNLLREKLQHGITKKYFFDILLGCKRTHRDFVYNYIHEENLTNKVLMTYFRYWNIDLRKSDHIFETDGLEFLPESSYTHSVHHVKYYGIKMNLSQIVPLEIYNNCYYTLITETNAVNEFNFFTEKTVKPILAKRLFVVIAGQGFLKTLKSYGFKTFDTVIDESYDLESNHETRWAMALEQVKYLTSTDPVIVQEKIKEIVEHNYHLIINYEWYDDLAIKLRSTIEQDLARTIAG
jgi:hypothetical protein